MQGYRSRTLQGAGLLRAWRHEDAACAEHLIVPHHEISLVALLSEGSGRLMLYGTRAGADRYRPAPGVRSVGVVLAPEVAVAALGVCATELAGVGDDVPAPLAAALEPLLETMAALDVDAALTVWTRAVVGLTAAAREATSATALVARRIRADAGRTPVSSITRELDLCERGLRRRMRSEIGLTPKSYSRLVRLLACVEASDRCSTPAWADLAARFGYADQAHLVRDCAALTGLTPARLHAERSGASEMFNTAA